MYDALTTLLTATTVTSAAVTGSTLNTLTGGPTRGYRIRVRGNGVLAATVGATAAVITPTVQVSNTSGTAWRTVATGRPVTLTTAGAAYQDDILVDVPVAEPLVKLLVTPAANSSTGITGVWGGELGDAQSLPRY